MNNLLLKTLLPQAVKQLPKVEKYISDYISDIELQPGETTTAVLIYPSDDNNTLGISIVTFKGKKISREINDSTLSDFITNILKQLK